jgi:hypothetical protein
MFRPLSDHRLKAPCTPYCPGHSGRTPCPPRSLSPALAAALTMIGMRARNDDTLLDLEQLDD